MQDRQGGLLKWKKVLDPDLEDTVWEVWECRRNVLKMRSWGGTLEGLMIQAERCSKATERSPSISRGPSLGVWGIGNRGNETRGTIICYKFPLLFPLLFPRFGRQEKFL